MKYIFLLPKKLPIIEMLLNLLIYFLFIVNIKMFSVNSVHDQQLVCIQFCLGLNLIASVMTHFFQKYKPFIPCFCYHKLLLLFLIQLSYERMEHASSK